jgi:hypothetical protein
MRGWLTFLAERCRLPLRGNFAELDLQIAKLRMVRDSYQVPPQIRLHDQTPDAMKIREPLCIQ